MRSYHRFITQFIVYAILGVACTPKSKDVAPAPSVVTGSCHCPVNLIDTTQVSCSIERDSLIGKTFRTHVSEKVCAQYFEREFREYTLEGVLRLENDSMATYNGFSDVMWLVNYEIKGDSILLRDKNSFLNVDFVFDKTCNGVLLNENRRYYYVP